MQLTSTALQLADNLTFIGTSRRITGDFTNATVTSRTSFQTSTANSTTGIYALPSGTSTAASWQATNNSDPTNASKILIATNGATDVQLVSGINGTGTYLPLSFYTNGAQKMRLDTSGNLGIGNTPSGTYKLEVSGKSAATEVYATNGIILNAQTTATSTTVPTGYNGMSVGPWSVASGETFTVASGSRHVVL
jgi:hypothetical protein